MFVNPKQNLDLQKLSRPEVPVGIGEGRHQLNGSGGGIDCVVDESPDSLS